jgi:hypothetical protein
MLNMSDDPQLIGIRAFARLVGVSHAAVQDAIKRGRLTAVTNTPRGNKLFRAEALEEWQQTRCPGNNNHFSESGPEAAGELAEEVESEGSADELSPEEKKNWGIRYTKESALLKLEQRKKVRLERMELEGKLHRDEDVEAVWIEMLSRFRTRILAIPAKLAPLIASRPKSSPEEVQKIIDAEVRQALTELAEHDRGKIEIQRRKRTAKPRP